MPGRSPSTACATTSRCAGCSSRVALTQSMDSLDPELVRKRRMHLEKSMTQKLTPLRLEGLETELHVQTVLAKANAQMIETIRRSQLLVIPTHSTFAAQPHVEELGTHAGAASRNLRPDPCRQEGRRGAGARGTTCGRRSIRTSSGSVTSGPCRLRSGRLSSSPVEAPSAGQGRGAPPVDSRGRGACEPPGYFFPRRLPRCSI